MKRLLTFLSLVTVLILAQKANAEAGLHIEYSDLKYTFKRHLTRYIGDCPGEFWSGLAQDVDLRFIDYSIEPTKKLKVTLINLTTGNKITRNYQKARLGSNDFNLTQLGNRDGEHIIEYQIYDRDTKETINTGQFSYNVTSTETAQSRDADWKLELYCAEDRDRKLKDCKTIASQKIKYCGGTRSDESISHRTFNLDRKTIEIDLD